MFKKLIQLLLACVLTAATASAAVSNDVNIEAVISAELAKIKDLSQFYQQRTASNVESAVQYDVSDDVLDACFAYYIPQQTANLNQYKTDSDACAAEAAKSKEQVSLESVESRKELLTRGASINEQLAECEQQTDALQFFQCYKDSSNANSQKLFKISLDSNDEINNVNIKYEDIKNKQSLCSTSARKTYTIKTAANDKDMQNCLAGISTPPAIEVSTEPTTVTIPDTPEETTTEEQPIEEDVYNKYLYTRFRHTRQ